MDRKLQLVTAMGGRASPVERWLVLATMGPVLATLLLQTYATFSEQQRLVREAVEAEPGTLARLSAGLASAALEFEDRRELDTLLAHVATSPSFDFAFVETVDGTLVASVGDPAEFEAPRPSYRSVGPGEAVRSAHSVGVAAPVGEAGRLGRLVVGLRTTWPTPATRCAARSTASSG